MTTRPKYQRKSSSRKNNRKYPANKQSLVTVNEYQTPTQTQTSSFPSINEPQYFDKYQTPTQTQQENPFHDQTQTHTQQENPFQTQTQTHTSTYINNIPSVNLQQYLPHVNRQTKKLTEANNKLMRDKNALDQQILTTQKWNESLQTENTKLKKNNQLLNLKITRLENYQLETKQNNIQLHKKYKSLNEKVSQLKNQQKQAKPNKIKLEKENQTLKKQLCELQNRLAKFECKENEIYVRNTILSYNSKNKQDIKPRHDIDNQQNVLQTLFDIHDTNMSNWIIFTQKMNKTYTNCKNKITKNNNNMLLWKSFIECKSLWQKQQNQMELIVQKLAELQKKKKDLKSSVTGHNKITKQQNNKYKQELNKYNKTNETRIKLENELKTTLKKLNNYCDSENKLNKNKCDFLDDFNTFNIELKKYELLLKHCNELMRKYRDFDRVNDTAIKEMENYFKDKWTESMKIWYEWSADSIMCWLKYLRENGTLILSGNVKCEVILKYMLTNHVIGKSFETIDKNDLKSIGFEILSDRQNVFDKIQELILRYPRQKSYDEEGKINDTNIYTIESQSIIPDEFKCPISKQIMNEPVLIFDGHTYEKVEIEKYLNTKRQSPKTKEKCGDDDIWFTPNRKLKQKIVAFKKVNPQFQ